MANTFTPTDVYGIVNTMAIEMFGANNTVTAMNTTTFVSVGEAMLRAGVTNTYNALSNVLFKTIYGVKRYKGKFRILMRTPAEWGGIERKISFYAKGGTASKNYNTDINSTQLIDGASIDPWKINKKYPLEINFCGAKTLEYDDTAFISQIKFAFTSEAAFSDFVSAKMVDIANDFETKEDAENRLMVLNAIGATYNVGAARQKVNLRTEFNTKYGTSYTAAQLMTTYLAEFVAFMVAKMKGDMELMSERNTLFHIYPARNDDGGNALVLPRHTPAEDRRLILYMPLIRDVETSVFPSLFNDSYVKLSNYIGVEYWQNPNVPMAVKVTPNQLNVVNGQSTDGSAVALDNVVGLLFDKDAMAASVKHRSTLSTGINPFGEYVNTVNHWTHNYKFDQTENMILYYIA